MELLIALLILAIIFLSVWLILALKAKRQVECARLFLQQRCKTFDEDLEHVRSLVLDLRADRHDSMKHITALHYLLEQGEEQEAKNYLDQLLSNYDATNLSLKGEETHLAAFLHHVKKATHSKQIEIRYDLEEPLSQLPLSLPEQSILVGNLLFNSLDAVESYYEVYGQGQIILSTSFKSGLYVLELSNSSLPIEAHILDHLFDKQVITSKKGEHEGLGTAIVARLVKKHHGSIDYCYLNKTFTVKIKLPKLIEL